MIASILFTLLLSYSFYGYGCLLNASNRCIKTTAIDWNVGLKMLLGFSLFLWLSGFIEFFQLGSKYLYLFFLFMGIGLAVKANLINYLNKSTQFKNQTSNYQSLLMGLFITVVTVGLLINLAAFEFNVGDDYQGYLIFAKKLIANGYQGFDPFSTRLVEQGFGGGNSINALFLSAQPLKYIHLAEAGTGTLMLVWLILGRDSVKTIGKTQLALSLLIAFELVVFAPIVNISPLISGCAMMLGILILTSNATHHRQPYQFAVILGFFLSSFLSLKGTFLAPAFVAGLTFYIAKFIMSKNWRTISEAAVTLSSFLFFLLPWLISNFLYHDTGFYPLLGKGFSTSGSFGLVSHSQFINSISELLPLYGLLIVAYFLLSSQKIQRDLRIFCSTLVLTTIITSAILAMTPGGFFRYSFVLVATPTAFLLSEFLQLKQHNFPGSIKLFGIHIAKYIFYFCVITVAISLIHQTKRNVRIFLNHGIFSDNQMPLISNLNLDYIKLQDSIPTGALLLSVTSEPHLFNFEKNTIYVMDYPGNAGPKPGIPLQNNYMDLAKYFISNDVQYVAHSYKSAEGIENDPNFSIAMNSEDKWMKNLFSRNLQVNKALLSFNENFNTIFDNGEIRVFDLCNSATQKLQMCDKNLPGK